ncbi:hypothetical protein ACT17_11415 [Mycolicibacterium conceptionense]|uniref:Uncharacterized protein n=1 Tax=Mycolicibacterium conceptionense TaxID=451644 RepID=A0A0J8UBI0_9MYCO|nr:hypothetical protein [Mycolicibacterium conceptionense]KMV18372.1 hypothetical protein ACT17_11415 [Mycolicibacterium conceptionense]
MSIELSEATGLAADREEGGGAIADQPFVEYLWSDLKARRNALSLWPEDLAPLLGVDAALYLTYEYDRPQDVPTKSEGRRGAVKVLLTKGASTDSVPAEFIEELDDMEDFVADEVERLIGTSDDLDVVTLNAVIDQETFTSDYPHACTQLHEYPYPVRLQYVAVGRAAAELRRQGRDVEVYRGERRFDLAAARFAVGLGKSETACLLGVNEKSYFANERKGVVRQASLNDLQKLDDFIADAANGLDVKDENGVSVIWVCDDHEDFEKAHPKAFFERSGEPYPVRMLWVAAGRRTSALREGGQAVRIAAVG